MKEPDAAEDWKGMIERRDDESGPSTDGETVAKPPRAFENQRRLQMGTGRLGFEKGPCRELELVGGEAEDGQNNVGCPLRAEQADLHGALRKHQGPSSRTTADTDVLTATVTSVAPSHRTGTPIMLAADTSREQLQTQPSQLCQ